MDNFYTIFTFCGKIIKKLIMKKLEKITINPQKIIKDEELVNLRGGDYGTMLF